MEQAKEQINMLPDAQPKIRIQSFTKYKIALQMAKGDSVFLFQFQEKCNCEL